MRLLALAPGYGLRLELTAAEATTLLREGRVLQNSVAVAGTSIEGMTVVVTVADDGMIDTAPAITRAADAATAMAEARAARLARARPRG